MSHVAQAAHLLSRCGRTLGPSWPGIRWPGTQLATITGCNDNATAARHEIEAYVPKDDFATQYESLASLKSPTGDVPSMPLQ